jgi:hypothetical protein
MFTPYRQILHRPNVTSGPVAHMLPFPRRAQYLIPAIRSGFFRVRPESLVQGQLTPFVRAIWQTNTFPGQSVMNG